MKVRPASPTWANVGFSWEVLRSPLDWCRVTSRRRTVVQSEGQILCRRGRGSECERMSHRLESRVFRVEDCTNLIDNNWRETSWIWVNAERLYAIAWQHEISWRRVYSCSLIDNIIPSGFCRVQQLVTNCSYVVAVQSRRSPTSCTCLYVVVGRMDILNIPWVSL